MGTAGVGLFDDDVANEVRNDYLQKLAEGKNVEEATREVFQERQNELIDADDGPVIWLALAATQWDYGGFGAGVQQRALTLLELGGDLHRWKQDPKLSARRHRVLQKLAEKLRRPLPPARRPRSKKPRFSCLSHSVKSPAGTATATVFSLVPRGEMPTRCQVLAEIQIDQHRSGGHVACLGCSWEFVKLDWHSDTSLQITYPAGALLPAESPRVEITGPKNQLCFHGHKILVTYLEMPG